MVPFRASRRRHGRELRGSLLSHLDRTAPLGFFETVVSQSVSFLKLSWPDELENLRWRVLDSPMFPDGVAEVPRYSVNPKEFRITIYRIPIERLTHHRRTDRLDERFHIEQFVFQAVAELLGKDPGDMIPDRYKH
ncbi:MAG: hypothetical protein RL140_25 [Actinomycetota bacterium]|jgi:hypothetical protein